jgi:hypothetical protein
VKHTEVKTLENAKAYLLERRTVSREALHMLCLQLSARDELLAFIREHNIKLYGPPGR